jgi:hypothetical protein
MGALVMGVLSALPFVAWGNGCCCFWIISGGVVAAYALQQGQPQPISPADGAFVGFLAGILGAFVYLVIYTPIDLTIGDMERALTRRMAEGLLDGMGGSEGFRAMFQRTEVPAPFRILGNFLSLLFVGAIFSTLGGVLGALIFRKREAPGAPGMPGTFDAPGI